MIYTNLAAYLRLEKETKDGPYHVSSRDGDPSTVCSEIGYCVAVQPRYADSEDWSKKEGAMFAAAKNAAPELRALLERCLLAAYVVREKHDFTKGCALIDDITPLLAGQEREA